VAGRLTKTLGGIGAGLAVVVAGATGVTWLSSKNADVSSGEVAQHGAASSGGPTQQAVVSQAASASLDDLAVFVPPTPVTPIISEYWVVNASANVEDFPFESSPVPALTCLSKDHGGWEAFNGCLGETPGCTPEQREWLSQNALLTDEGLFVSDDRLGLGAVTLKNTSGSAQSISFKDIRLEAEFAPHDGAGFSVVCSNYNDWAGGASAGPATAREVILPSDVGMAVFGDPLMYGEDLTRDMPAGTPAVFNLAAGETSNVQLHAKVPYPVGTISGRVLATVSAADGVREIELPLPALDGGESGYRQVLAPTLWVDGGTVCPDRTVVTKYTTMRTICSFAQLKAEANLG
jgi:hypothetical protein